VKLLPNLDKKGLCNGTRLYVLQCHCNMIRAEVLSECRGALLSFRGLLLTEVM